VGKAIDVCTLPLPIIMVDQSVFPESKSMLIYALYTGASNTNIHYCHFFILASCGHTNCFVSILGWPLKVTLLDQSGINLMVGFQAHEGRRISFSYGRERSTFDGS
jgi:hypothetical protein